MKKTFLGILFLLSAAAAVYGYLFCYFDVKPDRIVIVKEKTEGKAMKAISGKKVFVYEGMLPWLYEVREQRTAFRDNFSAEIPVSALMGVKSVRSSIVIPVQLQYELNIDGFSNLFLLDKSGENLKNLVRKSALDLLKSKIDPFLKPVYRGPQLKGILIKLLEEAEGELQDTLGGLGIKLASLSAVSPGIFPGYDEYRRGLRYAAELRDLNFENRKALEKLKYRLQEQKLKEGALYERYRHIAAIIKANPEILKYIYIDKISDNLKVIISSDKHGVPLFLEKEKEEKSVKKTGEIDNLR